jgi:glycosyltransferase involved in cell wall biosynthesis
LYKGLSLDYDLVICTDDMAVRYLVNEVPHIYYMLTPRRALYDMYYPVLEQYGPLKRIGYWGALNIAKSMDRRFVRHHVKHFACISHTVRNRIFKVYQREAEVIYPCVHTGRYRWSPGEGYWLSAGRVDKWKRVELQVEAFRRMPERTLLIAGSIYPAYRDMVSCAPPNVRFLGNVDEEGLIDLYARSEGFLTTAIDEDFGITPVEAMASGKPVIATKEGGYLETVIEGYTGLLISPDVDAIRQAVEEVSADPVRYREACQNRARMFDYRIFRDSLKDLVEMCAW